MQKSTLILVVLALAGFAPGAEAYLDPSTGSMIISAIVGLFASLALAVKTFWYRIKAFFTGKTSAPDDESGDDPAA